MQNRNRLTYGVWHSERVRDCLIATASCVRCDARKSAGGPSSTGPLEFICGRIGDYLKS